MKAIYRLLSTNKDLLRRMLNWPLLWRFAVNAAETLDHEPDASCLKCAARLRKLKFTHTPVMNTARQMVCIRCGLPMSDWLNNRHCSGKPPVVKAAPKPIVVAFPVNW